MKLSRILYIATAIITLSCSQNGDIEQIPTDVPTSTAVVPAQRSEFDIAKTIIMHEPGGEILPAMLHPNAALFDLYFNIDESQQEHRAYVAQLEAFGCNVLSVRDILARGCEQEDSAELAELRAFASRILTYDTSELSEEMSAKQEEYKKQIIDELSIAELVDIILLQPTLKLTPTSINTGITATYIYNPLMNLFYTRDQMITTAKGVIVCKMNSPQRQNECEVMKFVLGKIGVKPIYEVSGDGSFLEGGDLIMYPNISFIGCGLRTTQSAIDQLLDKKLFGTDKVVVVKDSWHTQAQMHLDTYFNIIDKDLATISQERYSAKSGDEQYVTVDIYQISGDKYVKIATDLPFVDYLSNELGMTLIEITPGDQNRLAGNYLTIAPRQIMAVANQSDEYKAKLEQNGVKVHWIKLDNLIKGYGAAHCMTQVIERK